MVGYPIPQRAVLEIEGLRVWAHVVCFEPGRLWLYPAEPTVVPPETPVRVVAWVDGWPRLGMSGVVSSSGDEALAVDVEAPLDIEITLAWWRGEPFDLGRLAAPPVQVRALGMH